MSEADDTDIALGALGALTATELTVLRERVLSDPSVAEELAAWESLLAPLAMFAPPASPPGDALEKIEARIDARARLEALSRTLRAAEGDWIKVSPGLRVKIVERDEARQRQTVLLDIDAGATYPAHTHPQEEEIFMISGDLTIGPHLLEPGDFHVSPAGSRHPAAQTRAGCRCLVSMAL
jgi:quercetin dioxygenase-like cupin family protein